MTPSVRFNVISSPVNKPYVVRCALRRDPCLDRVRLDRVLGPAQRDEVPQLRGRVHRRRVTSVSRKHNGYTISRVGAGAANRVRRESFPGVIEDATSWPIGRNRFISNSMPGFEAHVVDQLRGRNPRTGRGLGTDLDPAENTERLPASQWLSVTP